MIRVPILRVLLLSIGLLLAASVNAQGCVLEQEPNDTPPEANPLAGAACVTGQLSSLDQDAFAWTVSEEDSRTTWRFELGSVRAQKTSLELFRVELTEDGTGVLSFDSLLELTTPDGRTVTTEPRLFAPGTYILGLSVSGGEGHYTLALLPDEPTSYFRTPAPEAGTVLATAGGFYEVGHLAGEQLIDWTVPEELAEHLWHFELIPAVAETLELAILRPDGSVLSRLRAADGSGSISSLAVGAGTFRLELSSEGGRLGPYSLLAAPQGVATSGQEIEPNNSPADANALHPGEELRGAMSAGGDIDYFRFVVTNELTDQLLALETGQDESLEICLLDALNDSLQCRTGTGLPDLKLAAGEYGLRIASPSRDYDVAYTLLLSAMGEPDPLRPTEPNDRIDLASPLPEGLGVRGELLGEEADFLSVEITGEPQLWRVQVNGPGVGELSYYDAAHAEIARHRASGSVRLDNLYLLPGTHYFRVRGIDTVYTLRLLPLGPASAAEQPASVTPPPAEGADQPETDPETPPGAAPQQPRPDGVAEREPNDSPTQAELLRFAEPGIGLLTTGDDDDYWRFNLAADQYVRLTVTPPADAVLVGTLHFGDHSLGRAYAGPDGLISRQMWLPAGEYTLLLYADSPGEDWYQVSLERLDPFSVPAGLADRFPEWSEPPGETALSQSAALEATLTLRAPDIDGVAAYWPYGQRFDLELTISNEQASDRELTLDWHVSDSRWQPEMPEVVTVAADEELSRLVPVVIGPDAPDEPVVLTVLARTADGRQTTTAITFTPDGLANPVGSHLWQPLPDALLGGLDAAWSSLGAELVSASPEEEQLAERFSVPLLFNGMAPLSHDYMDYRLYDRVPAELGITDYPLTVRLAGSEPVELAGFLLNPTSTGNPASALRDFAVSVSLDGEKFTEVLRAELSPVQAEQAFVLGEPVMARYVRLHLLGNQLPSDAPYRDYMGLGTFKAVTTLESADVLSGSTGLNIADQRLGGHMVWSDPGSMAHSNGMLRIDEHVQTVRTDFEQESVQWVVGFHHERAAQVQRFEWLEHPQTRERFRVVELSVALDSPAGPWKQVGTWNIADNPAMFELEEPVWARYVRFTATGLIPRETYQLPQAISIFERPADEAYASSLGEWGHYSRMGPYEHMQGELFPEARTEQGNGSRDTAALLEPGERLQGTVQLGEQEAWYRITVPPGHNHLSVTLSGLPHRGFDYELSNTAGETVAAEEQATSTEIVVSASAPPGDYLLRIFEPPRSIVITWDTSGSVASSIPVIYNALERFAESISPGVEEVNLMPFDSPFLMRNWSGDPYRVLEAIQADPRNTSSSSGETALLIATQALAERPGKKAVILLTDGSVPRDSALWTALTDVKPQVFASSISSAGAFGPDAPLEQDLMQSYASVNGGHYEYVHSHGDFDVSFRRAAAWLRRPSNYTVSFETDQRWANASAWAVPELQRAADQGLIPDVLAGADLTDPISRAEFAAVAVRVYEALTGEEAVPAAVNPFTDTTDPEVLKAFNTELAVGVSATEFAPGQLLNREQAATILTRVFKKVNLPGWTWATDAEFALDFDAPEPFADDGHISPWASESVYFMAANGIITGTGNNMFAPRAVTDEEQATGYANATREQALLLAVRLIESR